MSPWLSARVIRGTYDKVFVFKCATIEFYVIKCLIIKYRVIKCRVIKCRMIKCSVIKCADRISYYAE